MLNLDQLAYFLQNAYWPQVLERRPTFFSIAGFPHYENVISNVYQFFLSTDSPHGLGSLCADALFDVIGEAKKRSKQPWQRPNLRRISVKRELITENGRLDLLLHDGREEGQWIDSSTTILIENKVYHWLANDLGDYWNFVEKQSLTSSKTGVVLSLKHEIIPPKWRDNWIAITHLEWAQAVEKRLGPAVYRAESRYLTLLFELIENIRAMTNVNEGFDELMVFVQQNQAVIQQAEGVREKLFRQIPDAIRSALSWLEIYSPKDGQNDGWLTATPLSNPPLKYELSYYGIVYPDKENHSFTITLSTTDNANPDNWQKRLRECPEVRQHEIKVRQEEGTSYVLSKEYLFNPEDYRRFPQLVADKLRTDWQPLEEHWLESPKEISE